MPKLNNSKHEAFCHEYMIDRNGTRAYKSVYKTTNENGSAVNANKLLRNTKILARIEELQAPILEKCEITLEWILEKHKELIDYGLEVDEYGKKNDTNCVNKSLAELAKLKGLNAPEKVDNISSDGSMSPTKIEIVGADENTDSK